MISDGAEILSDSDFDEFLRNFDNDTLSAVESEHNAHDHVNDHAGRRTPPPRHADPKVESRADRIRRERAERLNLNKK